jgi:RHH-type proline utilization regulon transcriptional repressor/proline dehydrogenase/delta 1-pyrroline-5-carboxylate dehydrogenase
MGPLPGNITEDVDIEALTLTYGREIFARLGRQGPLPLSPRWWDDLLMQWTMGDEAVKVQLFRFIDALPLLNTPAEINRHLREYFEEASARLPSWMRFGLRYMPANGFAGNLLARAAKDNAERLARRFIAGSNVPQALEAIAALRRRSLTFTVDLLGEATITESEAEQYQAEYLELVHGLSEAVNSWEPIDLIDSDHEGPLPRVNVSVKLSSLYSQFDPINPTGTSRVVRERLRPILRAARAAHVFVNFDMEQYAYKDATLLIFREILEEDEFRDWTDVGIAIQAYLRDCMNDLRGLAEWVTRRGTPVWVRLVKGAYWDFETVVAAQQAWPVPVYTRKWETDACYEEATRFLLENSVTDPALGKKCLLRPAIGSHNIRSLAYTLATAQALDLPPRSFEVQMLYGMAEPIKEALVGLGQRVRVYTPYGELLPGMAYLVRRLLENTANESFLRASFIEHVSEEQLLMNPLKKGAMANHHAVAPANGHSKPDDPRGRFRNEPLTDFSREEARTAMRRALDEVGTQIGRTYPLWIDGQAVATEASIDSLDPSHCKQIVGRCALATPAHAERAVQAAAKAFPAWRDTSARERAAYFFRAADIMRRRRYELAAWQVRECGKQWREADADVAETIDYADYYAHEMIRLAEIRHCDFPGEDNAYFYEPRGVSVIIAPWNFPLAILCGMTTAALVTGNTAIMKPAEQSSVNGAKLMEIFQEAGLPPGVVNLVSGVGEEIGPTLTNHPEVALIAFTGSKTVGLMLNRQATEMPVEQTQVKRVIAEMGGKNAIIVDSDADLDEAVHGTVHSAFGYQGQKCSACSRVIVLESLYDQFLPRLIEATRSLKIAPAEDPGCSVGPVIDDEARKRILEYIDIGKREANLVYAGDVGNLAGEGYYVAPHVFADVAPTARIAQEEIFGPVLAVMKARDLDEALQIANGTSYALTGGLYSRSPRSIARIRREFRVGNLYINRKITGALVERQPFGGFKLSGIGSKAGGPDYLLQFVLPRAITENTMRRGFAPTGTDQ